MKDEAEPYVCSGCGKPYIENRWKDCECVTITAFRRSDHHTIVTEPRCEWCNAYPVRANIDGDNLCHACCEKWARGEALWAMEQSLLAKIEAGQSKDTPNEG